MAVHKLKGGCPTKTRNASFLNVTRNKERLEKVRQRKLNLKFPGLCVPGYYLIHPD